MMEKIAILKNQFQDFDRVSYKRVASCLSRLL